MSLGKCKLKYQGDTTAHLLEWLQSKQETIPVAGQDMEQQEVSFIADGDTKWRSHYGKQFGPFVQSETQTYHTTQQSCCQAWPSRSEHLCRHKNVDANVYCSKTRTQSQYVWVYLTLYCANQEQPCFGFITYYLGPHHPPTRGVT